MALDHIDVQSVLDQNISQSVALRTVMPDVELQAVHFPLSAHFPDIAAAFHQIDLIPVHAFDEQIVFRLVG